MASSKPAKPKSKKKKTGKKSPVLRATEAQLYVSDVAASCAFFTGKLGFAVAFVAGDPPFYGQVQRDKAFLNLRLVHEPVFAGDVREREGLLAATITVRKAGEIERLFAEFSAAGVAVGPAITQEPWGASTFVVVDPDGNRILFAGPAA